jgi:hypothetical protein
MRKKEPTLAEDALDINRRSLDENDERRTTELYKGISIPGIER